MPATFELVADRASIHFTGSKLFIVIIIRETRGAVTNMCFSLFALHDGRCPESKSCASTRSTGTPYVTNERGMTG